MAIKDMNREQLQQRLVVLMEELAHDEGTLKIAREHESAVRREVCGALNRVNRAQKEIDDIVAALKAGSEFNTDWHSQTHRGVPVG